jgi:hypothetical protein
MDAFDSRIQKMKSDIDEIKNEINYIQMVNIYHLNIEK